MSHTANGDAVLMALEEAIATLTIRIGSTRKHLTNSDDIYQDDPLMLREMLWRDLDAMRHACNLIRRAEKIRKEQSPRRRAALERERKKRENKERKE